jgi:tetratricopeptide (TPR) repeat protein
MSEPTQDLPSAAAGPDAELLAALADDFAARLRRREHPTVEEYVARHPGLADRIRNVLSAVAMIEQGRVDSTLTTEGPGVTIGRYKLLERIGEGGFGVVYMAEQQAPVRRKVALKVIKPGMDSRQVLARFDAERQALAIMDHPNIAKVFDGGVTDTGRPYFVMELVKGEPITSYCDANQLAPRQRLELFVQVCDAVQHAHQKGIIHRDLKPTNVLVAVHDTTPVVKVIDFGVAKALGQALTDETLFTGFAQLLGTPLYMSPEQAGQSSLDVDTRSDIYSLGVLLYELLTGTTPFDRERFKRAAQDEIRRIIREEEPPRPSTRLSESRDRLPSISAQRHTEPAKLTKLVRGELDWIVMKALEKDRGRRYETATGFGADVRRYLDGEAVQAVPPSAAYRARKFIHRNKGPVVAAALVLVTLIAGIAGTTFGLVHAERARRALAERAEGERKAKQIAQEREAEAKEREAETAAVLFFVENHVFAAAKPQGWGGGLGYDVSLRRAIETAIPAMEAGLADRPLIEARLRATLAESFSSLGEKEKAAEQASKALALYTKHRGPDHPDTIRSRFQMGRHNTFLDRSAEAAIIFEETLANYRARLGPDHRDTLACMNALAGSYARLGRGAEAIKLREEALARERAKLGPNDGGTLISMMNLASVYVEMGRQAEGLKLYEQTLPLMIAKFGAEHPTTLICKNNLAARYSTTGRHAESIKLYEELLGPAKAKLGPDHPSTLNYMKNLAISYSRLGRHADAITLFQKALALAEQKFGRDDPRTLDYRSSLTLGFMRADRYEEAARVSEESLALRKAKFGADSREALGTMDSLVKSYSALGRHKDALKLREELLTLRKSKLGPNHADTLAAMHGLAWALATDPDPANRDLTRATALAEAAIKLAPRDAQLWHTLGAAQYRSGDWSAAIASLQRYREFRTDDGEWSNPFFLAMAHWQRGDKEEARRWYDTAVKWMDKNAPTNESLIRFRAEAADLLQVSEARRAPSTGPAAATSQSVVK